MALILIVDDSLLSRTMTRKIVKSLGHEFIEGIDGEDALSLIAQHQPDCICLDLLIPKFNGIQVLEKLKQQNNRIPVIMITADTQETSRQKCLDLGVLAVLNKPVKVETLSPLIDKALQI